MESPPDQGTSGSASRPASPVRWVRESREPGRVCFRVGRDASSLVAEWEGIGVLRASPSGEAVEIRAVVGLDPAYEEKWRRGLVRGLVRHLEGRTTLHGSAVAVDGRAVLFLGESGAGKSTCAADLCGRRGADLLADDTVELEAEQGRYVVMPSEDSHWLLRDSAEALGQVHPDEWKAPVPAARVAHRAVPLGAIVSLAFAEGDAAPGLSPLRGLAAFAAINAAFVRFVFDDPAVALRDLDAISAIVAAVPIVTLVRPRSLATLDVASRALAEFIHTLDGAGAPSGAVP